MESKVSRFSTLEPQGLSAIMLRSYIFMGPDGREYLWKLGRKNCKARTSETFRYKHTKTDLIIALRE